MRYEWDERKNKANQRKHGGVSFEIACLALEDPNCLVAPDFVDETGEARWHALGAVQVPRGSTLVLLVVHVYREDRNGEEIIRIISARPAEKHEVRRYQEQRLD